MLKKISSLCLSFLATSCFAALPNIDMKSCKSDAEYQGGEIVLHAENNHQSYIYLLHNTSKSTFLWLNHEVQNPNASAGWGSKLKAGNWSAIMVSQPKFKLACAETVDNKITNIPCDNLLEVCRINNFENKGEAVDGTTYWIFENSSFPALVKGMRDRKIYPIPPLD